MALAWNASWEQSLRGSNPLSSANENPLVPVTRGFSHARGLFRAIGDTAGDMAGSLWGRGWGHGLHLAGYGWRLVGIRLGSGLEAAWKRLGIRDARAAGVGKRVGGAVGLAET